MARRGLDCVLGRIYLREHTQALERAAKVGGVVTIPGGI